MKIEHVFRSRGKLAISAWRPENPPQVGQYLSLKREDGSQGLWLIKNVHRGWKMSSPGDNWVFEIEMALSLQYKITEPKQNEDLIIFSELPMPII